MGCSATRICRTASTLPPTGRVEWPLHKQIISVGNMEVELTLKVTLDDGYSLSDLSAILDEITWDVAHESIESAELVDVNWELE